MPCPIYPPLEQHTPGLVGFDTHPISAVLMFQDGGVFQLGDRCASGSGVLELRLSLVSRMDGQM